MPLSQIITFDILNRKNAETPGHTIDVTVVNDETTVTLNLSAVEVSESSALEEVDALQCMRDSIVKPSILYSITSTQRDLVTSPELLDVGLPIYVSDTDTEETYNGTTWIHAGQHTVVGGTNINITGPVSDPVVNLDNSINLSGNLTVSGRVDGDGAGGLLHLRAASNSPIGGPVQIEGGGASTTGGKIQFLSGLGGVNGGDIEFIASEGPNGVGGSMLYSAGNGGVDDGTGAGGSHTFIGGNGGFNSGDGGGFNFTTGQGEGPTAFSGSITLDIGDSIGGGPIGKLLLAPTRGKVGIGTTNPQAPLEVGGVAGSSIGGFPSGNLHVTGQSALVNANAVITGHNLFGGNKQLWYLGSASSSNDDVTLINRQNDDLSFGTNDTIRLTITNTGVLSSPSDLDIITGTGGVFKFNSDAIRAGQDASNYSEVGHGGSNAFFNAVGVAAGIDFRFMGTTKATFTSAGHLHLLTDTDQKHNLKIKTANNLNDSGIAWENSGGNFSQTIFRTDVGSNRSDLVFAIGSNATIDLLTNSFKIHGSAANEGRLEILNGFQISSGTPGAGKVLTSDASGIATWEVTGGGWTDDGTSVRLTTTNDKVGIGIIIPVFKLDVVGDINTTTDYNVGGTQVLSSTTLGSGVVNSSLTNVGVLSNLTMSGTSLLQFNNGGKIKFSGGSGNNFIEGNVGNTGRIGLFTESLERITIALAGNIGINKTSPGASLDVIGDVKISDDFTVATSLIFADVSNGTVNLGSAVTGTDRFNVFGPGTGFQQGIASFYDLAGNIKFRFKDENAAGSIPPLLETEASLGMAFNTTTNSKYVWYINGTGNEKMRLTSIGLGIGAAPEVSSILSLSSTTKGLLPPRMTTAQIDAIASPATGLVAFDTDKNSLRLRKTSAWEYMLTGVVTGQFSHAVSQKPSVTTPVSLSFDTNDITLEGISHSTSVDPEEFTATIQKSYTFMLAPQWERTTSGGTRTIDFFMQISTDGGTNFTDISNSNVKVKAGSADSNVIPLMATIAMNVNDIIRFQMRISATGDGLGTVFTASEVGPPTIPATPAQILTIFSGD